MAKHFLFVQTNDPAGNQILVYDRTDDGTLSLAETVDTGGSGGRNEGAGPDPLTSQGSLVYDTHHRVLIAVNAGSNTLSVLGFDDDHLRLRQVLTSGGTFPVSVTVHGDLVYVLNAHEAGAITGYRITDGQLHPIEGSTRSLQLTPATGPTQFMNTPAQIGFTPDGHHLVITTKSNGSLIDVFTMAAGGRPADNFVANPAGTQVPFGFTFDDHGHLVVTDTAMSTLSTYTICPEGTVERVGSQADGQVAMCWVAHTAGKPSPRSPPDRDQSIWPAPTTGNSSTYRSVPRGYRRLPHQARRHPRPDRHSPRSGRRGRHRRHLSGTCLTRRIRAPLPQSSDPVPPKGFGAGVAAVSSLRAVPPRDSTTHVLLDISRYVLSR